MLEELNEEHERNNDVHAEVDEMKAGNSGVGSIPSGVFEERRYDSFRMVSEAVK